MPVYPISFSIPEQKILDTVPDKTLEFATLIPGDLSTYTYRDESSYYNGYQQAVFGETAKKGGWDCLRHYEILANGCIPWFTDLEKCPSATMTHFPKDIVLEAMKSDTSNSYIPELLEYTRKNLTCRAMAQYVFNSIGCPNPKRVLFLNGDTSPDYLRCLTLIGMKQILGNQCMESPVVPHIYEDYEGASNLYGKGFTYTRILPTSAKPPPIHVDEIRNGSFDIVVYGSLHRGRPYWDEVVRAYPPERIVLLCGEDNDTFTYEHSCEGIRIARHGFHVFVRELQTPVVVQIGTNTGKDHVLELCKNRETSAVYLVEPFNIHNSDIIKNYANIPNVTIENIAITPTPTESVELFYTEQDGPMDNSKKSYQVASIKPEHIVKHDYDPSKLQSFTVPALTMNQFFKKHNLTYVDYLFLDIEGIDFEVLTTIDFQKVDIRMLQIEHIHLDKSKLFSFMHERGYVATKGMDVEGFDTMFVKQYRCN